jgi:HAD superfamily hydrolase (TIGR01509 family)
MRIRMMLSRQAGAPTLEGVPIRALLFDFDGTIVDTEGPAFRAWYETFEEHGHELLLRDWSAAVGTVGGYDPVGHLEQLTGRRLDPKSVRDAVRRRHLELVELEALRPGIADYVAAAQALRIQIAVVTSATTEWVTGMLDRLALAEGWHSFHAAEGDATIAKPRPDLYVRALQALDIEPGEAIAIEDSPNGVRAAKAAGILCVAVPNDITRGLELSEADLILESLADVPLTELLTWAPTRASAQ